MVPALVVSPGPSLRRNWNKIADLEGFDGPLIFGHESKCPPGRLAG
jgi:hypothetical protein